MKFFKIFVFIAAIVLSGCAQKGAIEVGPNATNYIMNFERGRVIAIRPVVIKDNGTGTFLGAVTGAILGSMVGKGNGTTLAMLAGGLGGAYAGNQLGKANAQELTIKLARNGREVVTVVKGQEFYVGERVRIVKKYGRRVSSVEPYNQ